MPVSGAKRSSEVDPTSTGEGELGNEMRATECSSLEIGFLPAKNRFFKQAPSLALTLI